ADADDIGLVHRDAAHKAVLKHAGDPLKITGFAVLQPNHRHLLPSCLHFDSTTVLEYCQQIGRNFLAPLGRNFLAPRAALNRTPDTAATAGPARRTAAPTRRRRWSALSKMTTPHHQPTSGPSRSSLPAMGGTRPHNTHVIHKRAVKQHH